LAILLRMHGLDYWPAAAAAAALLGFLPLNFPRAATFMGDSGSLLVGFVVAANLALIIAAAPGLVINAAIIVFYPIFDLALGIVRRLINQRPIFEGDRLHSYDQLDRLVGNKTTTTLITYLVSCSLVVIAVGASYFNERINIVIGACVLALIGIPAYLLGWMKWQPEMEVRSS